MEKKFIGMIIVIILAVVTVSGCIDDGSTNSTNNGSLFNDGPVFNDEKVFFDYPSDWAKYTPSSYDPDRVASLKTSKGETSLLGVFVSPAMGGSIEKYKSDNEPRPGETLISSEYITIDGVRGFDISLKYYSNGGGEQRIIGFIKNGNYYRMIFTTGDLDAIKSDMDIVTNSFKAL